MRLLLYVFMLLPFSMFSQDIEALSWKEATVSNKISLTIPKAEFDKKYKTDSISIPEANETCRTDESTRIINYKGAKFELIDGVLNFRKIDFRKRRNTWLAFENDWFDHTTTLKSFQKTYPGAAAMANEYEDDEGNVFELITVLAKGDKKDFEWHFYFADDKLQFIECFLYCD